MLQSSLTFQGEHEAWKQRVGKEVDNTNKFYSTVDMASTAFGNTGFSNASAATTTIHPYHRSNLDRKLLKKGNFYMIDSTYLVASDPNSMRDQGPCRNAEYYFTPSVGADDMSGHSQTYKSYRSNQTPQQVRNQYIKGKGNKSIQGIIDYKNRGVYSYGGKSKIGSQPHHNQSSEYDCYDPMITQFSNKWSQSVDGTAQIIEKDYHTRVNDYSKNVSQPIFNPGLGVRSSTAGRKQRRMRGTRRSINMPRNMKQNLVSAPPAVYQPQRTNYVGM